jgi:hypothetical protein
VAGTARQKDETEDKTMQGGGEKNAEKTKGIRNNTSYTQNQPEPGGENDGREGETPTAEDTTGRFRNLETADEEAGNVTRQEEG